MDPGSVGEILAPIQVPLTGTSSLNKVPDLQRSQQASEPDPLQAWENIVTALENNETVQMQYDQDIDRVVIQVLDGRRNN